MEKITYPIGTQLYLSQHTGDLYVDMVKIPYTVVGYVGNKMLIQEAKCNFPEPRYFDTMPTSIEEDRKGDVLSLNWAPRKKRWQVDKYGTGYPYVAVFGQWEYYPYLN